jgi:hypothetical protein
LHFEDPQYAARENILIPPDEPAGEVAMPNVEPPPTVPPDNVERLGPVPEAYLDKVFEQLLGSSRGKVKQLRRRGVA